MLALVAGSAIAAKPAAQLDASGARRAAALAEQLRCLVCQNQSIAESNAELAVDLRREINEQIRAGRSDQRHHRLHGGALRRLRVVSATGQAAYVLLWFGPALLAIAALIAFTRALRNRRRRAVERPLTEAEHAEAERLLGESVRSNQ